MSRHLNFLSALALISLLLFSAGCSSRSGSNADTSVGAPTAAAATTIFVERNETSTYSYQPPTYQAGILQFSASSSGTVAPTVDSPRLTSNVQGLSLDGTGNLYVGKFTLATSGAEGVVAAAVEVYGAPFSASSTPARTLELPPGDYPDRLFVDAVGQLYVLSNYSGTVYIYASGASGSASPLRVISGSASQLVAEQLRGLSVDVSGNLYVATYESSRVLIFNSAANGNVAPTRTLTVSGGNVTGVATDSSGKIYIALRTDQTSADGTTSGTASIEEFTATASGTPTPTHTIAGSTTTLERIDGMRIDAAGNLWLINVTGNSFVPASSSRAVRFHRRDAVPFTSHVVEFAAGSTGNIAPQVNFDSTTWGYGGPEIAIE